MAPSDDITQLLNAAHQGDQQASDQLLPQVYDELRRVAARHMGRERVNHTLQATALVSEAYLRLIGDGTQANDRVHFFALASTAMRRVLVDHARARNRDKRGSGLASVTLDEAAYVSPDSEATLLELDDALDRLSEFDSRCARAVELMFFGGLTYEETAEVLGVSKTTVHQDLTLAKAWLAREMGGAR